MMATLVFQTIGSALGGAVAGPIGATVGRIAGALGGALLDSALTPRGGPSYRIGPRLHSIDGVSSTEGVAIPRLFGRARIGGQMIWATRFLEQTNVSFDSGSQSSSGGKGGGPSAARVNVNFAYYANFAIGLCEGPIAFVRRIFADGVELDMTTLPIRIYRGTADQTADPLIVAKEGAENAPAYRDLAYVVFEQLPLGNFGNRIPQFTFEVVKPVAGLGERVTAIDLIPGATEAGYQPSLHLNFSWPGQSEADNRHQYTAATDWAASLDALQALCPNLKHVALVVAWFGDDLRAGRCTISPRVDARFKTIGEFDFILGGAWPPDWSVAGVGRADARLVSQIDGRAAFGGTPSDASVSAAIADLKARGLSVTFYPFAMMDVPADNELTDPYSGDAGQPAYPWRGRITCDIAPGRAGSSDGTDAAASDVAAFFTQYRPFVLHYATLCANAGGVDAFLIGSELVGLTRLRSAPGVYPAAAALVRLAQDVRTIVGAQTKLSYAADWTEYGAHVPQDGEVRFPLDPLWASSVVDFIGVDVYWPVSDWRDGDAHLDAAQWDSVHDFDYLLTRMSSGEGYDWYYADEAARIAQNRTPITDGLGKAWMFRQKDLLSFWSQAHVERYGGAELLAPTDFVPMSKPIWIVETGCPAVDRGANAPNDFPSPQSSEGRLPYFSRGGRDDLIQARFLEAMSTHFDPSRPGDANPTSPIYGGPMVDPERIYFWCWDARPFPAFPAQSDVWADAADWETGHWLNGRLEGAPLDALVAELVGAAPTPTLAAERPKIDGFLDGYLIDRIMSPREAIDPLAALFGFDAVISSGVLRFVAHRGRVAHVVTQDDLAPGRDGALVVFARAQESELPHEISLSFTESQLDYRTAVVSSRRIEGYSARKSEAQAAVMTHRANAQTIADIWLQDLWTARESATFSVSPALIALETGDIVRLADPGGGRLFQIQRITDGAARQISARAVDPLVYDAAASLVASMASATRTVFGPPQVVVLDLALARTEPPPLSLIAAWASPWPNTLAVWRREAAGFAFLAAIEKRAVIGVTLDPAPPGPVGRFDNSAVFRVQIGSGQLSSVDDASALAGKTAMALRGADGAWEIFAFARAELVAENTYRLSRLLRGLGGEDFLAARGAPAGSSVVLLDSAVVALARNAAEIGVAQEYRIGPADRHYADPIFARASFAATTKALTPYAPCRAKARRDVEGVSIGFIRRGRVDSDAWEAVEIPLGEEREAYEIDIALPGGGTRTLAVATPFALYSAAQELADFGAQQSAFDVAIYQISARVGRGFALQAHLVVA
jgi:hypothetical protein